MADRTSSQPEATTREVVITRIFDAPRELVWKAWTEPERLMRWWGPRIFTSPSCQIDLRVGGRFLFCMEWPDGRRNYSTGEFREVAPLERLAFTNCFADAEGNIVPATHYGMPDDIPLEMFVIVTFEDHSGKTKMTMTHAGLPTSMLESASQGWNESFDKLAASLRS